MMVTWRADASRLRYMRDGEMSSSPDAALVVRILDGDQAAFAAIYDRYADRLYDFSWSLLRHHDDAADATQDTFVRAAERLGQLRDPAMLRPWLYSIAKREALARLRARRRQIPDESVPDTPDTSVGPEATAGQNELRTLVWDAAAGLGERDQVLLNLHLRHGLDGAELAEAAGIRATNVYPMIGRFRERVERSLGALLVARLGRDECAALDAILTGWDGRFSVLIRKRVARHVDECDVCGERRRIAASPLALLSTVPIMVAPPELREVVLRACNDRFRSDGEDGGSAGSSGRQFWRDRRTKTAALVTAGAAALTAVIIAGTTVFSAPGDTTALTTPGPPSSTTATTDTPSVTPAPESSEPAADVSSSAGTTPSETEIPGVIEPSVDEPENTSEPVPPPDETEQPGDDPDEPVLPGELVLSTQALDLGAQGTSGAVTLSNVGGSVVTYDIASQTSWLITDHDTGNLPGGSARELVVTPERSSLNEGDYSGSVAITSDGGNATIAVTLSVENPPIVKEATAKPDELCSGDFATASAIVYDESEVIAVEIAWAGPDGSGSVAMAPRSGSWYGRLGPFTEPGETTWHVVATDARGNTGTGAQQVINVRACRTILAP
jgi:RNA polymerase sigma factor (sigma-70 family)